MPHAGAPKSALKFVPETLETSRLLLRAPRIEDAPDLFAAVCDSLPELLTFLSWATPEYSLALHEANIRAVIAQFAAGEGYRYHLFDWATGTFVGTASFDPLDWSVPKLELGYWLRSAYTGKGLMREAAVALCEMEERDLGAVRLEIRCDSRNLKSARVAEACGFELEGTLHNEARNPEERLCDTRLYA